MFDKRFKLLLAHYFAAAIILVVLCTIFPNTIFYFYAHAAYFILYVIVAYVTFNISKWWFLTERILPEDKAVLITGCDSGIGNLLAKHLDSRGFHVFAGCLFPDGEGSEDLRQSCSDRLQVLYLDVTKDDSVDKALSFVKQNLGSDVLFAVVNNAGILRSFTSELTTMQDFEDTLKVNTLGMVRVTKAFLPLLKESKGRLVNITSNAGRFAPAELCAYAMSKFAAVAFTDSISQEMSVWGVKAISIEPEIFRTPLAEEKNLSFLLDEAVSKLKNGVSDDYGEEYFKGFRKFAFLMLNISSDNINIIIDDIDSAVTMKYPNHTYRPRRNVITRNIGNFVEYLPYEIAEKIVLTVKYGLGFPVPRKTKYQRTL